MAKTTTISATLKIAPQIKGTYYSFTYTEERQVLDGDNVAQEKDKLWDDVYNTVANQINSTIESV